MASPRSKSRPIWPSAAIEAEYRRRLLVLVQAMNKSYSRWVCAAYRRDPPVMAQDVSPAAELDRVMKHLGKYWQERFTDLAADLAKYFAKSVHRRSDAALMAILKKGGIAIEFKMNAAMRDVFKATVEQNVDLIKSIPQQYHTQVTGLVMRSVQQGRDLHQLTKDLRKRYGVTKERAVLIASDQNNKATSALMKARQTSLGIKRGIWMHSHAGKEPRPTHLANDRKEFDIQKGWFDPDKRVRAYIMPGQLINCRCTWKPVIEALQ